MQEYEYYKNLGGEEYENFKQKAYIHQAAQKNN